jgi:outer membrane receptor for ferrienterochelin and colicins
MRFLYLSMVIWFVLPVSHGQDGGILGKVFSDDGPLPFVHLFLAEAQKGTFSDTNGHFEILNLLPGSDTLTVSLLGFKQRNIPVQITPVNPHQMLEILLNEEIAALREVVVSGTKRPVSRLESPVPVEVYSAKYFKTNPAPSVFEALQNVNGVRPQINCNICNTGDIHINGLEGPYTMILIDGMPIVSGLSTVYGLTGIPQSLIDRVEVVKGPASTLYGSEAVGGLINVITKHPQSVPPLTLDLMTTSWGEINTDVAARWKWQKTQSLLGVNYFNYQNPLDKNGDGFTDVTLQDRISVFNKWNFTRRHERTFSIAGRYVYEDRWGGEMRWNPDFRAGNEVYGESIYTNRWEIFGQYQLPFRESLQMEFSANDHQQNSAYGNSLFLARQQIGFVQLTWDKKIATGRQLLAGLAYRYTFYDDNTSATGGELGQGNQPSRIHLPGTFLQDEWKFTPQLTLLTGIRYDYNSIHGHILSPRVNMKWNDRGENTVLRISAGNGYRVANIFTEDHAALTGARAVVFKNKLLPERSWNVNLNLVRKIYAGNQIFWNFDVSAFYTHFSNRILPDYETDVNQIIYDNLDGYAVSRGLTLNVDFSFPSGLQGRIGSTLMDVSITEDGHTYRQLLTEKLSGTWSLSYKIPGVDLSVDYTGNIYSPMRLPLLGPLDDRPEYSPWFSLQNLQLSRVFNGLEIYSGIKNLLNFTPPANSIARPFDPFDNNVQFDAGGQVISTPENPQALTFDPTYVFAPNQGIRMYLGIRFAVE